MTKARDFADIAGAVSGGKIASADVNVSFENISDTGTEGTKVATGTTAQRGSTTGQWRYNTTTGFFEGRNTSGTFSTLEPTPTVSSVDDGEVDSAGGGNQTIVITGTNFSSGAVASFVGNAGANFDAATTTVDSATQITAVAPKSSFLNAQEPYKVKVTSSSGVAGTSATGLINVDNAPSWTTSAGSLGSIGENATGNHFTVAATDPDGDTVSYSLQSGSLAGLSLNSSTGVISGDPTDVTSDTTNSFTLRATAGSKTADRAFTYVTQNLITDINSIPESIWNSIPTGQFSNNATHTDYYGGRFDVNTGNIMQFRSEYTNEHVMYQRANSRSNSNEECYIQMYDIDDDFGDASNGNQVCQFGIVEDDVTSTGYNNNTAFGYVSTSFTKMRYTVWGQSDVASVHGFYTGGAGGGSSASIGANSTNREVSANYRLNEYQLNFTPTNASTRTAITFVIKPDNHSTNARKVYMYYGNTKVHTFANTIGANSTVHFYCGIGQTTSSNGDFWTNNPPRIRFGDNNGSASYDVGG